MKTKILNLIILTSVFLTLFNTVFATEQLYTNYDMTVLGQMVDRNNLGGSVGADFTIGPNDVWVDSLGFYDKNEDGLGQSHRVAIWDSSDSLVVEVTIPAGTSAELSDNFRWMPISGGAVKLNANTQYTIGGEVTNGGDIWKSLLGGGGLRWPLNSYFVGSNQHYCRWNNSGVWGVPNSGNSSWDYGYIYGAGNLRTVGLCFNNPPLVTTKQNQVAQAGLPKKLACTVEDDGKPYQEGCDPCNPNTGTPYEHTYTWLQLSGPATVVFDNNQAAEPNALFTQRGWYEIEVEVWDGPQGEPSAEYGMTGSDSFSIYVFDPAVDNKLLGDWRFEENSGVVAGDIADTNDYGAFSTLDVNLPNWTTGVEEDSAIEFIASDSSYIEINNLTVNDPNLESLKSGTIAAWFKCDPCSAADGSVAVFSIRTVADSNYTNTWITLEGATEINDASWHHAAVTYDALNGDMQLYIDGKQDANLAVAPSILEEQWQSVLIGSGTDAFDQSWGGAIDDVQIYSYALSADQVRQQIVCGEFINADMRLTADIFGPQEVPDCHTNLHDFSKVAMHWSESVPPGEMVDISGPAQVPDNVVDIYDLDAIAQNWLNCNDPQDLDCTL